MFVRGIVASLNKLRLRSRRDEGEKRKMGTGETKKKRGKEKNGICTTCIIINRPGANRGAAESERTIRRRQRTQARVERPRESI